MSRVWSRLDAVLTVFENAVLTLGTALAVIVATVQVVLRYGGGTGLFWAEEFVVYAVVWTSFLAASAAVRYGDHLSVELIRLVTGRGVARAVTLAISALGIAFSISLVVLGAGLAMNAHDFGQTSSALQMPMWIVYLVMPLAGVLMTIRFLQNAILPRMDADEARAELQPGAACR